MFETIRAAMSGLMPFAVFLGVVFLWRIASLLDSILDSLENSRVVLESSPWWKEVLLDADARSAERKAEREGNERHRKDAMRRRGLDPENPGHVAQYEKQVNKVVNALIEKEKLKAQQASRGDAP